MIRCTKCNVIILFDMFGNDLDPDEINVKTASHWQKNHPTVDELEKMWDND